MWRSLGECTPLNARVLVKYAVSRYNFYQRDTAVSIYIAESLRLIGKGNGYISEHLNHILAPTKKEVQTNKTGEELVAEIAKKIGLEVT